MMKLLRTRPCGGRHMIGDKGQVGDRSLATNSILGRQINSETHGAKQVKATFFVLYMKRQLLVGLRKGRLNICVYDRLLLA